MPLSQKTEKYLRAPWRPMVEEGDGELTDSKFSGMPWLAAGEPWPSCKRCEKPMQLFLQLNLDTLPKEFGGRFGTGLLQLFYCTNAEREDSCEVLAENWFPNNEAMLVRIVHPDDTQNFAPGSPVKDAFPPTRIARWEPLAQEFPSYDELSELEELSADEEDELEDTSPDAADKLWGWPCWVQSVEYPMCPQCGNTMELVFQLASEDNLPYMFGDVGIGHLTQCRKHHDEVRFGWACS